MQEQDTPFGSITIGGALENIDKGYQGPFQAEDRILAFVFRILEELVAGQLFLVDHDLFAAVAGDHIVEPLIGRSRDLGITLHGLEVLAERAGPVFLLIVVQVLATGNQDDQIRSSGHGVFPS